MPHCYNAQLNIKERHARTSANESKHINAKFLCTFVTLFKVIALPLKRRRTPYGFYRTPSLLSYGPLQKSNEYEKSYIDNIQNWNESFQLYILEI